MDETKLGVSFHRTFAMSRDMVRQCLECAARYGNVDDHVLRSHTSLGTVLAVAARRYAYGTGLLDASGDLTVVGRLVFEHDPMLLQNQTLWLLHYHLCAPHRTGPAFWNHLVRTALVPGSVVTTQAIASEIGAFVLREGGEPLVERTQRSTATVFLGTYAKDDGLGRLGWLVATKGQRYEVRDPAPVPSSVFAYAICDFWDGTLGGLKTVNLDDLVGYGSLSGLFAMNDDTALAVLREMQQSGMIEIHRIARPYQVVRLWTSAEYVLERIYGS
ncbi:MAG: DUF4007 family protein [Chthonomonadales bacterium]|nr:DUF4007 family protein [Chthonomonadales bacterium]